MISLKQHAKKLSSLGVTGVYLFGSQALGTAGPVSDFDVGVLVEKTQMLSDRKKRKALYDVLYDLLSPEVAKEVQRLCNIDIVFLQDTDLQLQYHVAKHGKPLFEKDPNTFANFVESVMERYADFAPLRHLFTQAILARI
mgnify:CR=1 FL=1